MSDALCSKVFNILSGGRIMSVVQMSKLLGESRNTLTGYLFAMQDLGMLGSYMLGRSRVYYITRAQLRTRVRA